MIPKIIHFCWFGGNPLPELAQKCIASWRRFLPDYEIWQWGENENVNVIKDNQDNQDNIELAQRLNFLNQRSDLNSLNERSALNQRKARLEHPRKRVMEFDVEMIPYTAEAYRQKKYAFVSDYARFWILYKYGGIYFDTDVEVIKPLDEIISQGNFMGFEMDPDGENSPGKYAPRYCFDVAPGLGMGFEKENPFIKLMLDKYEPMKYETPIFPWGKTIVAYTTEELCKMGLENKPGIQTVENITIYPHEYFAPINVISGRLHITENTYTIHQYMGSWGDKRHRSWKDLIRSYIPEWVFYLNNKIKRRRYKIK